MSRNATMTGCAGSPRNAAQVVDLRLLEARRVAVAAPCKLSACVVQLSLSDIAGNLFHPNKIILFSLSAVLVKPDSDSEHSSLQIVFIDGFLNERRIASLLSNS